MRYFDRHRKRLTKHHYIRGTLKSVSGEQEVKIEDSAGVPFNKIEIAGNTFQKTYKGYQQIEILDFDRTNTDDEGNVITWSCRNGVITVNGKTNKIIPFTITADNKTLGSKILKAGTYTFTVSWIREQGTNGVFGNALGCDCRYNDTVTGERKYVYITGRTVLTFENDINWAYFQPYITKNKDIENAKFAIGVFKGDVATADFPPYEPYVGGIPSPNPGQVIKTYGDAPVIPIDIDLLEMGYVANPAEGTSTVYMVASANPIVLPEQGKEYRVTMADGMIDSPYDAIVIGSSQEDIANGRNIETLVYVNESGEQEISTVTVTSDFYVGVGNTNTGIPTPIEDPLPYWDYVVDGVMSIQKTEQVEVSRTEIPAYPQEIVNANNGTLPEGYQQVEYIESTGTQYIDTGVLGKNTLSFYTKTTYTSATLFGTQDDSNADKCIAVAANFVRYLTSSGKQFNVSLSTVDKYELEISNIKATVYYNNTSDSISLSPTNTTIDYPIYLFARNINGNASGFSSVKIYSFKIWDNDVLIRDFIPCYRTSDNVIGLYDTVHNVFYTNQGTGTFLKGANSEGMSLTLHGDNLFNQDDLLTDGNFKKTEYNGFECIKVVPTVSKHRFPCYAPQGNVTLSFKYATPKDKFSASIFFVYEDGTEKWYNDLNNNPTPSEFINYSRTLSNAKNIAYIELRFFNIPIYNEYYFKDFMVNVGAKKDYEPYFREEIAIPQSVEVEGETVELNVASISTTNSKGVTYTATDYLTVDRLSNKVLYHQNVGKKILTSDLNWELLTYNQKTYFWLRQNLGAGHYGVPVLSNKYFGYIGVGAILKQDYGITMDTLWYGSNWRNVTSVRDIRFDNIDDFKADLDQNPLEIEYGLAEEITHDITSTELGQALLKLCVERGLDGTLRVESELGISSISCDYYSQESEDKVVLTVSYQNEAGDALMDDKTHNVRRGSKYQIVSPQIEGYEPTEKEAFGVADGDLTIILKYKEVSDATV